MRGIGGLTIGSILAATAASAAPQPATVDTDAVVRACVPADQLDRPMNEFSPRERAAMVACWLRASADQIAGQLPLRVDNVTVLQSVTAEGQQVTYQYEVSVDSAQIDDARRAALIQSTRDFVCGRENMRTTMSYGGSFRYIWRDQAGIEITRTVIDRC